MDSAYTKPVKQAKQTVKPVREKPFVIPEDSAEPKEYVTGLHINCPFEYITLGGISFEKKVLPPEATLTENAGKQYFPRRVVRLFTEKQAKALKDQAEKHLVFLPRRKNPDAEKDQSLPAFLPESTVILADYFLCEPVEGFDERRAFQKKEVKPSGSTRVSNSGNK